MIFVAGPLLRNRASWHRRSLRQSCQGRTSPHPEDQHCFFLSGSGNKKRHRVEVMRSHSNLTSEDAALVRSEQLIDVSGA